MSWALIPRWPQFPPCEAGTVEFPLHRDVLTWDTVCEALGTMPDGGKQSIRTVTTAF